MSAAINSKPLPALRSDSRSNLQHGHKASPSPSIKPSASSTIRTVRRKPVPAIPAELLSLCPQPSQPLFTKEKNLEAPTATDVTPVKQSQHQYVLKIDAPTPSRDARSAAGDDAVRQLVRSASVSPAAVTPVASLGRKSSITAQFKNVLRRNRVADPKPTDVAVSGPSNCVHLSTGAGAAHPRSEPKSLRRSSTMQSMRTPMSSSHSGDSSRISEEAERYSEDKPLYTLGQPLRPQRSIRRPAAAVATKQEEAATPTSTRDKRKAIYASPASVAAMLEPLDVGACTITAAEKLSPILGSATTPAAESFASTLDRTLGIGRAHAGSLTPEPELGYESSCGTSNRSSLASLNEFKTLFDFPMERQGSKGPLERDIWAALDKEMMAVPQPISKI